jgi:hypothetical protein
MDGVHAASEASMMDLEQRVSNYFRAESGRFGLAPETLKAERILNWGGFGGYSYTVGDGDRTIHVKLTTEPADLRRWLAIHDDLERDYHAPRVLAWVDIPGAPLGSLVFEHIDGASWDIAAHPELIANLRDLLGRLHADRRLADRIGDGPRSYRECWDLRYCDQFEQDLIAVRARRPESITDARVAWMEQESRKVLAMAADHEAFAGLTRAPCHWDLWPNNIMVDRTGRWWVLDWDSLAAGDEAEDLATLLWPFVHARDSDWRDVFGGEGEGPFAARMDLHLRAITLDYVIDVLADWAECDVPEWREHVRQIKEEEHHRFLDWYRSRWG